jgi:phosphoglycerate kinase
MAADLQHLDVKGKKVLVRVDFNVPLGKNYEVTDDTRLRGAVPTIQYLVSQGAKVILLSHFDRPLKKLLPDGEIDRNKFSLKHVVEPLSKLLDRKVEFSSETIGDKVISQIETLKDGEVILLENTRFHPGEEKGDSDLARQMSSLGDLYVNDAFGAAHREHASTAVIAKYFNDDQKAFGFLMKDELDNAKKVLETTARPFVAILGGAKVSDKILLIESLLDKADKIIIGGGMAYTFIKAQGGKVGASLVEEDKLDLAIELVEKARKLGKTIVLPSDSIAAEKFAPDAMFKNVPSNEIPESWMGLDIGLTARFEFAGHLKGAGTILWNGPMGVFEMEAFSHGTKAIAQAVADATSAGTYSLIGGGDSVAAIHQAGLSHAVSFISTGGGAMLELLEGKTLPGVAAILQQSK